MGASQDQPQNLLSLDAIIEGLAKPMARLDLFFQSQIESFEPEIRELVTYTFNYSGKRLRPILTFFAGAAAQGELSDDLIRGAAVVEMTHLATLVHDDILDDADLRRNVPTIFKKHGSHVSVLLGDAIFAHALYVAAQFPTTEVCQVVSLATQRVCSGEISQTFQRGNSELSLEAYYRIINLKTAELFDAAAYIGAYLAGYEPELCNGIRSFARHLGIAYQMYDDVADMLGNEERLGKTLGTDLQTGKFTLPLLLLLEKLSTEDAADLKQRIAADPLAVHDTVIELLDSQQIFADVKTYFLQELSKAETVLEPCRKLPAYTSLQALSSFIRAQIDRYIP